MSSFSKDENSEDILLSNNDQQVMMAWEKPYMEACIDFLRPQGDVLEIGFGCGYSASQIMKYPIKSYTIVECDPVVLKKLFEWKKQFSNVSIIIISEKWQNVLHTLGKFDTIFMDDFPLGLNEKSTDIEIAMSNKRLNIFIDRCLMNHTKVGSKISAYLNDIRAPQLTSDSRPFVRVTTHLIDINIPKTCKYRDISLQNCLVPIIEIIKPYDFQVAQEFANNQLLKSLGQKLISKKTDLNS